MGKIFIEHKKRVEGLSEKEIQIGDKILNTIQTVPKIQSRSDLKTLLDNEGSLPEFQAVAVNLSIMGSLESQIHTGHGQLKIDGSRALSDARELLEKRLVLFDPETEWYRYRFTVKKEEKDGIDIYHTKQSRIFDQSGFPSAVRSIFEKYKTEGHNTAWERLRIDDLLLAYVHWHWEKSLKYGSNIIVPPSPMVDGKSYRMLKISALVNQIAKELTFDHAGEFCSFYVPLHPDTFDDDKRCFRVLKMIHENVKPNTLLLLKFFRVKKVMATSSNRIRLGRFLSTLDMLKLSMNDNLSVMTLDSRSEALPMFGNGIDLTIDPMGGVVDEVPYRRKKKSEKSEYVDVVDEETDERDMIKRHGRYLHPDTREFEKLSDLITMLPDGGPLPHDCMACKTLHGRLCDIHSPEFPNQTEWNASRRIHNFIFRKEEDAMVLDAIEEKNYQALKIYLSREGRGNKNLIDLIRQPTY